MSDGAVNGQGPPLRAYLGVLLGLFALTALVSILLVRSLADRDALRAARADAQFAADLAATDMSDALALIQSTVARTAAVPGIGAAFAKADCVLTFGAVGPFGHDRLDLVRLDGTVLCSSAPVSGGSSHAGAAWLRDPTAATALAAPVEDPRTKRMSAISAAPVPGSGLLVGIIDLTDVGPALASRFAGPAGLEFLLTTADGQTVIARSVDPAKWAGKSIAGTPFARASDPSDRPDVDGVPRIYASATVASAGWALYAGADRAAALIPVEGVFRQHVAVTLAGMVVLLLGTLLVYRKITVPIQRLTDAMGRATSALAGGAVAVSGPAEIARLAVRFNALVAAVRTEMTKRARAEEVARASEHNYQLMFASIPQPLFVYDIDTLAFLEVNDAAITRYGYTRDEFRSRTVMDILTPDQAHLLPTIKLNPEVHHSGPWTHRSKDGALIDVELTSIGLRYDGRDARLVVVEDLTERKRLEGRLQQSQRLEAVGQLAGGIAHDFNNLLAVILNYAEFVADALPEGDVRKDVAEIQRAASRAADLTRQLLIFARREVAKPQPLDLNAVVAGMENLLRRTIGESIGLKMSLSSELPSVEADPGQIEQVFLNLAINARDAMPGGGQLVVETSAIDLDEGLDAGRPNLSPGRYVQLSVSDTGVGMSAEVMERAFEPFFTTKPEGQGTGLGLATVYGIVTGAGGNIGMYSEPGLGTRVSIHLPAIDAPATAARPVETSAIPRGDGRIVLVVEDETAVLVAAVRILEGHGYRVNPQSDPTAALAVLDDPTARVDILLTDVVMPVLSGFELARRGQELRPGLPVLYMSGYSQDFVAHRGTLPAGSNVLQKPFTRRVLLVAIDATLGRGSRDG
jgi:PAS domain S-box-containing protein